MERDDEEMVEAGAGEAKPKPKPPARRTRLVRVDQELIDYLLKQPPPRPFPVSDEQIRLDPMIARAAATVKRNNDRDADILHQYRTRGYAEVEEELTDDDDDEPAAATKRKKPDTRRKRPATRKNNKLSRTD